METTIPVPPAAVTNAANEPDAPCYSVAFNVEFADLLIFSSDPFTPLADVLKADVKRALTEAGIFKPETPDPANPGKTKNSPLVFARLNHISGLFWVTDWRAALPAVETELQRIGLLPYAEIGWRDYDENIWRRGYPKPSGNIFSPLVLVSLKDQPVTPKLQESAALLFKLFATVSIPPQPGALPESPDVPSAPLPTPPSESSAGAEAHKP